MCAQHFWMLWRVSLPKSQVGYAVDIRQKSFFTQLVLYPLHPKNIEIEIPTTHFININLIFNNVFACMYVVFEKSSFLFLIFTVVTSRETWMVLKRGREFALQCLSNNKKYVPCIILYYKRRKIIVLNYKSIQNLNFRYLKMFEKLIGQ